MKRIQIKKLLVAGLIPVLLSACAVPPAPAANNPPATVAQTAAPQTQAAATQAPATQPAATTTAQGPEASQTSAQTDIVDGNMAIPDLVEAHSPAVVTVAVRKIVGGGLFGSGGYQEGVGTGFFIDANGIIATNNHVVEGAKDVTIILHDSQSVPGKVLWTDPANDLAIVQVDKQHVKGVVTIGNSDKIRVGEGVIAIGNPMSAEFAGTVTHGIISAKNRKVQTPTGAQEFIQIDAAINGGNSGGPLFNMKGEVIGINSAKIAQTGIEGIAFSIPINVLMSKLSKNPETKDQTNAQVVLGISVQDIPADLRAKFNVPEGIMVMEVAPGSSAEKAGILQGDILTSFGGQPITSTVQLNTVKAQYKAGEQVKFSVYRDSDKNNYEGVITLEAAK